MHSPSHCRRAAVRSACKGQRRGHPGTPSLGPEWATRAMLLVATLAEIAGVLGAVGLCVTGETLFQPL